MFRPTLADIAGAARAIAAACLARLSYGANRASNAHCVVAVMYKQAPRYARKKRSS
jgi:hypothetical protein